MPSKNPAQRLQDILDNIAAVRAFTEGMEFDAFAAAGNIYRHEYETVDEALVWHTVQNDLEPLRLVIESELERLR